MFRMNYNSLYIQHLKYILFCCTLVSKCIQVGFTEIQKENLMVFGLLFIFSCFLSANLLTFFYLKSSRHSSKFWDSPLLQRAAQLSHSVVQILVKLAVAGAVTSDRGPVLTLFQDGEHTHELCELHNCSSSYTRW